MVKTEKKIFTCIRWMFLYSFCVAYNLHRAWGNSQNFTMLPLVSLRSLGNKCRNSLLMMCRYVTWLVEANFPCGTTNKKHYPDMDSITSLIWNFQACSSDIICGKPASWNSGFFPRLSCVHLTSRTALTVFQKH